jgi:hypothetical protein
MRRSLSIIGLVLLTFAGFGAEKVLEFRDMKPGITPLGFRSVLGGTGQPGEWKISTDEVPSLLAPLTPDAPSGYKQPVLAQVSRDRTDERFPMLVYEDETFGDFTLTTRFKIVDGQAEQMAGIAFRLQDEKNYYYIRASALGGTFYFFKIADGQRFGPIGNKVAISKGVWHDLSIECKGSRIRALLNGKEAIPWLDDPSFAAGKIAFWTKSDSVSHFGDTQISYKPKEILAQTLVNDALKKYPRLLGLKIYAATTNDAPMKVVGSMNTKEVGEVAPKEAEEVLIRDRGYFLGKGRDSVAVTVPLRDSNGEKVAAVRVIMQTFLGQTEKNALVRAMPVVKDMESRIRSRNDLIQ